MFMIVDLYLYNFFAQAVASPESKEIERILWVKFEEADLNGT